MHFVDGIAESGLLHRQSVRKAALFRYRCLAFNRQRDALFGENSVDLTESGLNFGEADIRSALVEGFLDFHGAESDAKRRFCMVFDVICALAGGKNNQRNQLALLVVQASLLGNFAVQEPIPNGRKIRVGFCQRVLNASKQLVHIFLGQDGPG